MYGNCLLYTSIKKGDILVTRSIDKDFVPILEQAGGLITEVGGLTSHGAIVGLELGIPTCLLYTSCIVLIFQALLLAHGGISTLGANTFSMAVAGPFVAYFIYKISKKAGAPIWLSVFFAAMLGDLMTYVVTSVQLALAFPMDGSILASFTKFGGIFAITQIPLAISEGLLTALVFNLLTVYSKNELQDLSVLRRDVVHD